MDGACSAADRHIPPDLIDEILLSLPAKSLVRFRCVSRQWNSKITAPSFTGEHFFATRRRRPPPQPIISDLGRNWMVHVSSTLISISDHRDSVESATRVVGPFDRDKYVTLLAYCEELWCVRLDEERTMFLWNPSMGTYKEIPAPPTELAFGAEYGNCNCYYTGMGYDPVSDDFKLLKVPCADYDKEYERYINRNDPDRSNKCEATVLYSLRNDAWTKVAPFPGGRRYKPCNDAGALVRGALHWMIYPDPEASGRLDMSRPYGIISFDISTREYGEVELPEYGRAPKGSDQVHLTVLKGMLSAYVQYGMSRLVVWCMRAEGETSWAMSYVVRRNRICRPLERPRFRYKRVRLTPLCGYEDGRILVACHCTILETKILCNNITHESEMVVYKDDGGESGVTRVVGLDGYEVFDAYMHTGTLISPAAMWPRSIGGRRTGMSGACMVADRRIPADIIDEILLNLPAKSLVRFRSVSRQWNSKITAPSFAREHFFATRRRRPPPQPITSDIGRNFMVLAHSTLISISDHRDSVESATRVVGPFNRNKFLTLLAYCEELWCVRLDHEERKMFLWNPIMGTYKEIPATPTELAFGAEYGICNCYYTGMGYDPVSDDFKLLKVPCAHDDKDYEFYYNRNDPDRSNKCEATVLYSLRNDAWTKVAPFPGGRRYKPCNDPGALVRGALHWMIYPDPKVSGARDLSRPHGIVSFDISTHEYGEVELPEYGRVPKGSDHVHLTVLKGMLSAYVQYGMSRLVVWCMRGEGETSWAMSYVVTRNRICRPLERPRFRYEKVRLIPMCGYEDGRILVACHCLILDWGNAIFRESEMVVYKDDGGGESGVTRVVGLDSYEGYDAYMHTGTLISPAAMWPRSIGGRR